MTINLYNVVALEEVGTDYLRRIAKTVIAENEENALEIFYKHNPHTKYAKANLKQEIKADYILLND